MQWSPDKYRQRLAEIKKKQLMVYDFHSDRDGKHIKGDVIVKSMEKIYETLSDELNRGMDTVKSWGRKNKTGPGEECDVRDVENLLGVPAYYFYDLTDGELADMPDICDDIKRFNNKDRKISTVDFDEDDLVGRCHYIIDSYFDDIDAYAECDIETYSNYATQKYDELYKELYDIIFQPVSVTSNNDPGGQLYSFLTKMISLTVPQKLEKIQGTDKYVQLFTADEQQQIADDTGHVALIEILYQKYKDLYYDLYKYR